MSERPEWLPDKEFYESKVALRARIADLEEERGKLISSLVAMDEIAEENGRLRAERYPSPDAYDPDVGDWTLGYRAGYADALKESGE